jgi:hypothetical protein
MCEGVPGADPLACAALLRMKGQEVQLLFALSFSGKKSVLFSRVPERCREGFFLPFDTQLHGKPQ